MAKKLRLAFVAGLSDKKLAQKLEPLTLLDGVERIDVFRRSAPPRLPKLRWVRLPASPRLGEPLKLARLLAQGYRYDALVGCFQLYHGLWAHLAGRAWRRPVIQLIIDNIPRNMEQPLARLPIMGASACGVRGPLTLAELRDAGYNGPAAVIHNPFAVPAKLPADTDKRFDCIAVGNFNAWKDYPWMAEVFAELRRRGVRLSLAFGGVFPESFKTRMAGILGKDATFLGPLGEAGLGAAYAASRCLLMTSSAEGLPMVAVEAMAQGLPVVATTVGDLPWLVREGREGHLVAHGDTPAMATTLAGLADAPGRFAAMGEAARERVCALAGEFSPERIAGAWDGLFTELGLHA